MEFLELVMMQIKKAQCTKQANQYRRFPRKTFYSGQRAPADISYAFISATSYRAHSTISLAFARFPARLIFKRARYDAAMQRDLYSS